MTEYNESLKLQIVPGDQKSWDTQDWVEFTWHPDRKHFYVNKNASQDAFERVLDADFISGVESMRFDQQTKLTLPQSLANFENLKELEFFLPTNFENVEAIYTIASLEKLGVQNPTELPSGISALEKLKQLQIRAEKSKRTKATSLPDDLEDLSSLERLGLIRVGGIKALDGLANLVRLEHLKLVGLDKVKSLPSLPPNVRFLRLESSSGLTKPPPDLAELENIDSLAIIAPKLKAIPDLSGLTTLRRLYLEAQIAQVPGLPTNLERIKIVGLAAKGWEDKALAKSLKSQLSPAHDALPVVMRQFIDDETLV